jgi:hypothetical protein
MKSPSNAQTLRTTFDQPVRNTNHLHPLCHRTRPRHPFVIFSFAASANVIYMLRRLEVRPLFAGQEQRITTALVALPTATAALLLFASQGATEEHLVALARPEERGYFIEARQVGRVGRCSSAVLNSSLRQTGRPTD